MDDTKAWPRALKDPREHYPDGRHHGFYGQWSLIPSGIHSSDEVPGHVVGEGPHVLEQVGAVPALHVLHHHAEVLLALEAAVHRDHEGVVSEGEDVSLRKHLLNLELQSR